MNQKELPTKQEIAALRRSANCALLSFHVSNIVQLIFELSLFVDYEDLLRASTSDKAYLKIHERRRVADVLVKYRAYTKLYRTALKNARAELVKKQEDNERLKSQLESMLQIMHFLQRDAIESEQDRAALQGAIKRLELEVTERKVQEAARFEREKTENLATPPRDMKIRYPGPSFSDSVAKLDLMLDDVVIKSISELDIKLREQETDLGVGEIELEPQIGGKSCALKLSSSFSEMDLLCHSSGRYETDGKSFDLSQIVERIRQKFEFQCMAFSLRCYLHVIWNKVFCLVDSKSCMISVAAPLGELSLFDLSSAIARTHLLIAISLELWTNHIWNVGSINIMSSENVRTALLRDIQDQCGLINFTGYAPDLPFDEHLDSKSKSAVQLLDFSSDRPIHEDEIISLVDELPSTSFSRFAFSSGLIQSYLGPDIDKFCCEKTDSICLASKRCKHLSRHRDQRFPIHTFLNHAGLNNQTDIPFLISMRETRFVILRGLLLFNSDFFKYPQPWNGAYEVKLAHGNYDSLAEALHSVTRDWNASDMVMRIMKEEIDVSDLSRLNGVAQEFFPDQIFEIFANASERLELDATHETTNRYSSRSFLTLGEFCSLSNRSPTPRQLEDLRSRAIEHCAKEKVPLYYRNSRIWLGNDLNNKTHETQAWIVSLAAVALIDSN